MKLFIAATLSALTLGAGAQASHGSAQLAASLGVEPGLYSLSQLSLLSGLRSDDDNRLQINDIIKNPEGVRGDAVTDHRTALDPNGAGWRSLALSIGVEPGRYSPAELTSLKAAISGEDRGRIAFITSGVSIGGNSNRTEISAGAAQLARSLGVEPGLYSLTQLVQLKSLSEDSENISRVRQILENPAFG